MQDTYVACRIKGRRVGRGRERKKKRKREREREREREEREMIEVAFHSFCFLYIVAHTTTKVPLNQIRVTH